MTWADIAKELGASIEAGRVSRDEAARQLQQYSDGGLTLVGAEGVLARWRTVRAQVADTMMSSELGLAAAQAEEQRRAGDG